MPRWPHIILCVSVISKRMAHNFQAEQIALSLISHLYDTALQRVADATVNLQHPLEALRTFVSSQPSSFQRHLTETYRGMMLYPIMHRMRTYLTELPTQTRSVYDSLFFHLLGMQRHAESDATAAFESFVLGISVFASEPSHPSEKPIYHRSSSCGPKSMSSQEYNATRRCSPPSLPQETNEANKARIFKCFLERLVYDKIFERYNLRLPGGLDYQGAQDAGHARRLETTRQDFLSCFPNTKLGIRVVFDERNVPFCLFVHIVHDDGGLDTLQETTETYIKATGVNGAAYGPLVYCRKQDGRDGSVIYKFQSRGTGPMPWGGSAHATERSFNTAMSQWVVPSTSTTEQEHHMFGGAAAGNMFTLKLRTRVVPKSTHCALQ